MVPMMPVALPASAHFHEFLLGTRKYIFTFDQFGIYIDLTHVIHDDSDPHVLPIGEYMVQQSCLAGPQKAAEHRDRQPWSN